MASHLLCHVRPHEGTGYTRVRHHGHEARARQEVVQLTCNLEGDHLWLDHGILAHVAVGDLCQSGAGCQLRLQHVQYGVVLGDHLREFGSTGKVVTPHLVHTGNHTHVSVLLLRGQLRLHHEHACRPVPTEQ